MQIDYSHENETELARLRRVISDNELYIAKLKHSLDNILALNRELEHDLKKMRGEQGENISISNRP